MSIPNELKACYKDMIDSLKTGLEIMKQEGVCELSIPLTREKVKFYIYLHNGNVPKAKSTLVKIERLWQELHYLITFENNGATCIITDTEHLNKDDGGVLHLSNKDDENSVVMGNRMIEEIEELKEGIRQVVMVLDVVKNRN
jgi:hypothetical protein